MAHHRGDQHDRTKLSGVCERCRSEQRSKGARRPHTPGHRTRQQLFLVFESGRVCGSRAPRPRCMPSTLPLASCRTCAAQRKNTINQSAQEHGNPRRARHPSVMTAGVCSPSVPADHGAAFAGRVCRRVQAGTSGSPFRNHPLSHAAIAPRSTPRLAFYGVGCFRRSSLWHVLGHVARDGGLGHHRVQRMESPGGQDEDSLCTPREAAGGFTSEGPFCEGRPERNAPEGNQVVSRFRGVWIVTIREPLDLAVAMCAAIASRVASESSFCRTRPGHGCRRQARHGHHHIVFFVCGVLGRPSRASRPDALLVVGVWKVVFFVVPTPRRNSRVPAPACGPRVVSHWPGPRTPKYNAKFLCSVFSFTFPHGGTCLPCPPPAPHPSPLSPLTGVN